MPGPAISETLGVTLDSTDSKLVPSPTISETLSAIVAPAMLDVSDSPLATADSTVQPLQASTQSALSANWPNLDARTNRIVCLRSQDRNNQVQGTQN